MMYFCLLGIVFFYLSLFILANSADPDEMPPYHLNAALCGISSGSSLSDKVPVYRYPE